MSHLKTELRSRLNRLERGRLLAPFGHRGRGRGAFGVLCMLTLLCAACVPLSPEPSPAGGDAPDGGVAAGAPPPGATERVRVQRVVDGDSLVVDGFDLRLIAVNAPERGDPLHRPARDFLAELVSGQEIYLERDVEVLDQYGRDLAYAYLDDGRFVNLELVRAGFAQSFTVPPNVRYVEQFQAAEATARREGAGLWRPSELPLRIAEINFDAPGRDEENPGGEWVEIRNDGNAEVQLAGATLSDEANTRYTFPSYTLVPGGSLRLHSGSGRDGQGRLYWGGDRAVWNNGGDAGILRDAEGLFVDVYRYEGRAR
jgi:micrococcal nuclease